MIVARPTFNAVFSMSAFLILVFAGFSYTSYEYFFKESDSLFIYFAMIFSGGLGFGLLIKFLWNWKSITIAKEKFQINYPFRFTSRLYSGKQLIQWTETTIKTFGGQYSELALFFDDKKKITMSKQEHTDYDKSKKYLLKKFKSKRKG